MTRPETMESDVAFRGFDTIGSAAHEVDALTG